ncbi:MAG: DUF1573 domain-containing protein [Anaerolineae bacterium]
MSRKARRRRQPRRRINWLPIITLAISIAVLIGVGIWYWNYQQVQAAVTYSPEDVVYGEPLSGVHEMEPAYVPIPFLPEDGPQPRIRVPQDFRDLGSVGATDIVEESFVIRNSGEADLTISHIYTTCGCTTAELTSSVIPPGKVALLKVIFDAGFHDTRGQSVRRGVIIENNDRRQSKAEVWIEAYVRP